MFFDQIPEGAPDPVFGLLTTFAADPRPDKVNLLVGIYQDEQLKSELLPSVKKAKEEILSKDLLASYLPIDGAPEFLPLFGPLLFGEEGWKKGEGRLYGAQTPGGTGALRIGAEFLKEHVGGRVVLPNYTWPNHRAVFERAGFEIDTYPYYESQTRGFELAATSQALSSLPPKTVVLLHACCHNPTGCDPTFEEWRALSRLMREKKLIPFFDFAYQGLGEGLNEDRKGVDLFVEEGHEMLIAYSCSKNFSMYCQRVGMLWIATPSPDVKRRVATQVKRLIRPLYSNPPAHGARIVSHILSHPVIRSKWEQEVGQMRLRLSKTREALVNLLSKKSPGTDFSYLRRHKGMFSFFDLSPEQVAQLRDQFGIYLLDKGRANIAGLHAGNLEFFVESLLAVLPR